MKFITHIFMKETSLTVMKNAGGNIDILLYSNWMKPFANGKLHTSQNIINIKYKNNIHYTKISWGY